MSHGLVFIMALATAFMGVLLALLFQAGGAPPLVAGTAGGWGGVYLTLAIFHALSDEPEDDDVGGIPPEAGA